MVARKTPYAAPESRQRQEDERVADAFGYKIRSQALDLRDGILYVKLPHEEHARREKAILNLSEMVLPPNTLHKSVSKLTDRPELVRTIVAVVDAYILRQQSTKSTPETAASLGRTVVNFLEFCWLHDIYSLKEVTPKLWNELVTMYVEGGWPNCLQLSQRASRVNLHELPLSRRRKAKGDIKYSATALLRQIGTNISENQVRLVYSKAGQTAALVRARQPGTLKAASVQQLITHLNNLADLPKDLRVPTIASANPYLLAQKLGAAAGDRTENFAPDELAKLLCESYRWIESYSPLVVRLLELVHAPLSNYEMEEPDESKIIRLLDSSERLDLEANLGVRITSVMRIGDWNRGVGLLGIVRTLIAACFLTLGVFNGRRKDELQGRSIGLYSGSASCLDDTLQIFECDFYCEKTTHGYKHFYINEISFKAIRVLEAISKIAWDVSVRNGGVNASGKIKKLFCVPPRGFEKIPVWYDYSTDKGARLLNSRASGLIDAPVPNAHMFRRAYAVVFMYRYENPDLYSLSQQLDHRDLGMTMHYLLESPTRDIAKHAAAMWGDGGINRAARAEHAAALSKEIRAAADEKLGVDVLAIVEGKSPIGGGFGRLVQRFARVMFGRIKYDDRDLNAHAKSITDVLLHRGHSIEPLPHGNCAAGNPRPGAKCFRGGELAKERASPITCASCPYHLMRENHRIVIHDFLKRKKKEIESLPVESVRAIAERKAIDATEQLLAFYDRMAIVNGAL